MPIVALKTVGLFSAFSTCKHFASWSKIHSYTGILNTMCRAASPCGTGLRCYFTLNRLVWSLPVTWQRWRSNHSIRSCRKPPAIRKLDGSIFYRTGVIAHWIFLHCGNRQFRVFLWKIMENVILSICVAKLMQMMPKHIFWPIIDSSSLYAAGVTRIVLRRMG